MGKPASAALWELLTGAADVLFSVLFPAPCHLCGQPLTTTSRIPVCSTCLATLRQLDGPLCRRCGRPFPSGAAAHAELCALCARGVYRFELARSYGRYDSGMDRILVLLKHQPIAPLGAWLAERVGEVVRREPVLGEADWLVPVPLDRTRLHERGYNQIDLIARPLGRRLGLPVRRDVLERLRPRPNKLKLSRRERWDTVRGAFRARRKSAIQDARILLVDDVLTSGATLDACARALRAAGAKSVKAVTVARVIPFWEPAVRASDSSGDSSVITNSFS